MKNVEIEEKVIELETKVDYLTSALESLVNALQNSNVIANAANTANQSNVINDLNDYYDDSDECDCYDEALDDNDDWGEQEPILDTVFNTIIAENCNGMVNPMPLVAVNTSNGTFLMIKVDAETINEMESLSAYAFAQVDEDLDGMIKISDTSDYYMIYNGDTDELIEIIESGINIISVTNGCIATSCNDMLNAITFMNNMMRNTD